MGRYSFTGLAGLSVNPADRFLRVLLPEYRVRGLPRSIIQLIMAGSQGHSIEINRNNLLLATVLNLIISIAEVAGGLLSGSLALFSDALHNLGDAFATLIAYLATKIADKKSTPKRTFGLKRIEILAALLNAVILVST